jgi:5-methylcytosine-specific restriction endonuclease McrA
MFDHAFESSGQIDDPVRREHAVFARDDWRCSVPGCSSFRNLHDHHIVARALGGG